MLINARKLTLTILAAGVLVAASIASVADARPGGGGARAGAVSRGASTSISSGGGNRAGSARGANRVNSGNANIGSGGNRVNTGNINVGNDINVNVDNGWNGNRYYNPVARGVAVGVAVGVSAAVVGSMVYSLPPSCSPYYYSNYSYYHCGSVWYRPQYQGTSVTYVVVNAPN